MPKISVIIPAYNEGKAIGQTVQYVLKQAGDKISNILVVDGGSSDNTITKAKQAGAVVLQSPRKGRAVQMNYGAAHAQSAVLYFLHADTLPPRNFALDILKSVKKGLNAGCFRLSFNSKHPLLQGYAWFTRFNADCFRFGDQSLFITHAAFDRAGGFREDHIVMEDQEIVRRIKKSEKFIVLSTSVVTSARRYLDNGVIRLQLIFTLIYVLYYMEVGQVQLKNIYNRMVT